MPTHDIDKSTLELIVDADVLVYRIGFSGDKDDTPLALQKARLFETILNITDGYGKARLILTPSGKLERDTIATIKPYKGNRATAHKPKYYKELRTAMLSEIQLVSALSHVVSGYAPAGLEADDTVGELCTEDPYSRVLWSEDKDLLTIPCIHAGKRTGKWFHVSEKQAGDFFIEQLLTGDTADNIPGLFKLTGQRATKKIKQRCVCQPTFQKQFDEVLAVYAESVEESLLAEIADAVHEIAQLLWIRRADYPTYWDKYEASKRGDLDEEGQNQEEGSEEAESP